MTIWLEFILSSFIVVYLKPALSSLSEKNHMGMQLLIVRELDYLDLIQMKLMIRFLFLSCKFLNQGSNPYCQLESQKYDIFSKFLDTEFEHKQLLSYWIPNKNNNKLGLSCAKLKIDELKN